jgi:hypothetical protein
MGAPSGPDVRIRAGIPGKQKTQGSDAAVALLEVRS